MADLRQRKKVVPEKTFDGLKAGLAKVSQRLTPHRRLASDPKVRKLSIRAVSFAVFIDCICSAVLRPNYPAMVGMFPNPEQFPADTKHGIKANLAMYLIPGCTALGSFIAGMVLAPLSDKIGRKPCMNLCLFVGAACSILKYLARKSFLQFCGACFLNGLFGASSTVAIAYIGDVFAGDKSAKDAQMGMVMAMAMLGDAGGGVIAILFRGGLFDPLFISAGLSFFAGLILVVYMVDAPKGDAADKKNDDDTDADAEDVAGAPKELDRSALHIIIGGALVDNIGSAGLQMCISPVMINAFGPLGTNVMTMQEFQWISTLLALAVIPGLAASLPAFKKYGYAGACVFGNLITAVATVALLYIAMPALDDKGLSSASALFVIFAIFLYSFYPITVISQLSTGPMLEAIAPVSKRGYVQGLSSAAMEVGGALSTPVLGFIGDEQGDEFMIWVCVGVSILAAIINFPLTRDKRFQAVQPAPHEIHVDDEEAMAHWPDAEKEAAAQETAMLEGTEFEAIAYGKYSDDKPYLPALKKRAHHDLEFYEGYIKQYLAQIDAGGIEFKKEQLEQWKASRIAGDKAAKAKKELGEWFTDYLVDVGYTPEENSTLLKQFIVSAFPPLFEGGSDAVGADDIEVVILRFMKLVRTHAYIEDHRGDAFRNLAMMAKRHG